MFFVPSLTPIVATAALWAWILAADIGPLNNALALVGIKGPRWFGQAEWAIPAIAIIVLWGAVGGSRMITFLAGLQGVPQELYDAAEIDGANAWQRFRHVTLPLLTPVIFFNLVLGRGRQLPGLRGRLRRDAGRPRRGDLLLRAARLQQGVPRLRVRLRLGAGLGRSSLILIVFTQVQFRGATRWVHYEGEQK